MIVNGLQSERFDTDFIQGQRGQPIEYGCQLARRFEHDAVRRRLLDGELSLGERR